MRPPEFVDIVVRVVPGYGFLPLVRDQHGRELYRGGAFQDSTITALRMAFEFAARDLALDALQEPRA